VYRRKLYLDRVKKFIDKPVIKIITGMRRVGKSYFLKLIMEELQQKGVIDKQIIYLHFDSLEFDHLKNHTALNNHVLEKANKSINAKIYLFIDEIQEVDDWEKCIESLFTSGRFDIYISGSNAHMLSSELATKLSGRYVEFPIYTLGFYEYMQFMKKELSSAQSEFRSYLIYGGFPALIHFDLDREVVYQYISSIYNTILLKDVVKRNNIRNISLLENITNYAFDNIGNIFSAKKLADYLKSQQISLGVETVQNYLAYICSTYALHKVRRYDIKGKRYLKVHEKYYLGDIGLRNAIIGYREGDVAGVLENIVYLELLRRGYSVSIGKFGDAEIDFIATKSEEKIYIQVTYLLASEKTIKREFSPLLKIADNYPKYVLSMDEIFGNDYEGVQRINIVDFLLSSEQS
jgi:predicted AAA+ superfamily ATPase